MFYPIHHEIIYQDPQEIAAKFSQQNGFVFLDSSQLMPDCGRYSFIAIDPFSKLTSKNGEIFLDGKKIIGNPWEILSKQLEKFSLETHQNMPPFQGGAAGFFSYDLYQHLEKIFSTQQDDMQFPDLAVGFYDLVIAFDNKLKRAWIFSSGLPENDKNKIEKKSRERLEWLLKILVSPYLQKNNTDRKEKTITSNFESSSYCSAVEKVKNYILSGDIFQANIAQRFQAELTENSFDLYCRLRAKNPAPFSAYLFFDDTVVASASPERFLKLENRQVETRPIKGTRPRGKNEIEDRKLAQELMQSEKDFAENVMIVDLMRNDLSRVCQPHTVKVTQLCGLESYAAVHHLVSVVTGKLAEEQDAISLLRATFPGGSITGAPKIRAMEIIAEIEPTRRGPYCGSVGYIGFNGNMDTSILIRTYAIKNNIITFQAGGAVTMDSDAVAEYEETLTKAKKLREVLYDFTD